MAKKKTFKKIALFIIFPLIAINSYAYWKLSEAAGHWSLKVIPTSTSETLTQLAIILAINNIIIVYLLIYNAFRG